MWQLQRLTSNNPNEAQKSAGEAFPMCDTKSTGDQTDSREVAVTDSRALTGIREVFAP